MGEQAVSTIARARVYVSGHVQGVNFRAATRDQARQLQVCGWVRNLPDGRVEALFEGAQAAVDQLVSWCYRGPVSARVSKVQVHWEPPTGSEEIFRIMW